MTVEQKVTTLKESQRRIERLAYYREPEQQELSFVDTLEVRLEAIRRELRETADDGALGALRRHTALSFAL